MFTWPGSGYGTGVEEYADDLIDRWGCAWNFEHAGTQALEDWVVAEQGYRRKFYVERAQVVACVSERAPGRLGAGVVDELLKRLVDPGLPWGVVSS